MNGFVNGEMVVSDGLGRRSEVLDATTGWSSEEIRVQESGILESNRGNWSSGVERATTMVVLQLALERSAAIQAAKSQGRDDLEPKIRQEYQEKIDTALKVLAR